MKKSVLLTGGSGFIGRNVRESYLSDEYDVFAPTRAELDLADTANVDNFFGDKTFDTVIHCAAKAGHRNAGDRQDLLRTNLRIFANLEQHRDKYRKFVNCGSGAVYDIGGNISDASECDLYKNIATDDHGFCKYLLSKQIQNLSGFIDLNIFGIFGKYEDYAIRFISNAICKTLFDLPITLRQNRRFSYIYVDDLCQVLEFFIENDAEYHSYNIVMDSPVNLYDLADLVKKISGKNLPIYVAEDGFGLDYYGNNGRLRSEMTDLKFSSIENSIRNLYDYYRNNRNSLIYEKLLVDI
jgi:GDP-L-fucose synthase